MAKGKKRFGKFWAKMLIGAIDILRKALGGYIADANLRMLYDLTLKPSTDIVNALSDENPDNGQQIAAIFQKHLNQAVIPFGSEQFEVIIAKIKDPALLSLVKATGVIPFAIAKIYTDENPDNDAQLKTYLESFVENPENQKDFLQAMRIWLGALFKNDPMLLNFMMSALEARILEGELINVDFNGDGV